MITAENNFWSITRNISFFKKLDATPIIDHDDGSDFDDETPNSEDNGEHSVNLSRRYPMGEREITAFFNGKLLTHGR